METRDEKQVAKRQEAGLPSDALFEADAKKGFENVDQESVALPILKLLQNGSAEHKENMLIMLKVLTLVCFSTQ